MRTLRNYLEGWTEPFREWLAWKLFPEFGFYIEAYKRMGEVDENERCLRVLEESGSKNAAWAQELISIKYVTIETILKKLKEEGFDEPPF
jgi:hypothetical protein